MPSQPTLSHGAPALPWHARWSALWRRWHDWSQRPAPFGTDWWLNWVCTLLFCMAVALVFTALSYLAQCRDGCQLGPAGWARLYGRHLVVSATIGLLIHLGFELLGRTWISGARVRAWSPWQRNLFFTGVPLLGTAAGWPLGMWLAGADLAALGQAVLGRGRLQLGAPLLLTLVIGLGFHLWFRSKAREIEAERRATEAQLKLLQGQIEPHFLFNTLAGVVAMIEVDPPQARRMLQGFTEHLRQSLAALRRDDGPLADELALVRGYLQLMQLRMEDRLRLRFDIDPAAEQVVVPPLLLQPLVENAIHHGLEPAVDGGTLSVQARVAAGLLTLTVHDDGRGLDAPPRPGHRGAGMALANLRERLASRYGAAASLQVTAAHPGTRATLQLPLAPMDA